MRRRKERTESSEGEERYYGKDGVTKSRALGVVILMGAFLFFQVAVFIRKEKRGEEKQAETALPFEFNPNTISSDSLVLLGFTQKQAQVVLNYRASGGRFRKKEDFAKIYSVSEEMFKKLYNYIAIPTVPEDVTRKTTALADGRPEKQDERRYSGKTEVRQWKYRQRTPRDTAGRSGASRLPERKKRVVELNGADSAELVKLYGIGGYYAKRIIEYRERLGNFYTPEQLQAIASKMEANRGDLILVLCGQKRKTQTMLGVLRIEMGNRLGLRDPHTFAPLWVIDFPLLEWDDETQRFYAMHHPFTAPKPEHLDLFYSDRKEDLEKVCANAYDFVLNGTELGGGSIRIHDSKVQQRMFEVLGFSDEDAQYKFGFIINAFKFGAPPHGGLAFGFDRVCALFGGQETIRDYIAFPKNNQGRDVMIDSPSYIDQIQMDELFLASTAKKEE